MDSHTRQSRESMHNYAVVLCVLAWIVSEKRMRNVFTRDRSFFLVKKYICFSRENVLEKVKTNTSVDYKLNTVTQMVICAGYFWKLPVIINVM